MKNRERKLIHKCGISHTPCGLEITCFNNKKTFVSMDNVAYSWGNVTCPMCNANKPRNHSLPNRLVGEEDTVVQGIHPCADNPTIVERQLQSKPDQPFNIINKKFRIVWKMPAELLGYNVILVDDVLTAVKELENCIKSNLEEPKHRGQTAGLLRVYAKFRELFGGGE